MDSSVDVRRRCARANSGATPLAFRLFYQLFGGEPEGQGGDVSGRKIGTARGAAVVALVDGVSAEKLQFHCRQLVSGSV
jgi:hypothetical protein